MKKSNETSQFNLLVPESLENKRLDIALVELGIINSRSQGQKLISKEQILVNGKVEKSSYKVQPDDHIEAKIPEEKDVNILPYDIPLDIIFEDDQVIVVNKPAGLVVHPACGHLNDTLINALVAHNKKLSSGNAQYRPGLVHRIDKGTSGLLVLAKNEEAHAFLAKQFLQKTTHRRYWAVVYGEPKESSGTIKSYLTRDPSNRKRISSNEDEVGKHAITHYKTLALGNGFSLLELQLETGRTHQIRVHLSGLGHPIAGDDVYGGQKRAKNLKNQKLKIFILKMERFALHAKELGFVHPTSKEQKLFSVDIPEDLKELFELSGLGNHVE